MPTWESTDRREEINGDSHLFLSALGTGSPQFLGNLVMTFIVEICSLRGDRSPDVAVQSLQVQIAY